MWIGVASEVDQRYGHAVAHLGLDEAKLAKLGVTLRGLGHGVVSIVHAPAPWKRIKE